MKIVSLALKTLSLMLVVVFVLSLAVLAANVTQITQASFDDVISEVTVKAKITDSSTGLASKQVTMLVYPVNQTPDENNIIGVDQLTSNATGDVEFTFGVEPTVSGTYTVLVGGEDVDSAASTTIQIGPSTPGHKVYGVVGPISTLNFVNPDNDPIMTELHNYFDKAEVKLLDPNDPELDLVIQSTTVEVTSNPTNQDYINIPFELTGVADGNYYLALSRRGMCTKLIAITVNGSDVNVGTKQLMGADIFDGAPDFGIDFNDVLAVLNIFNKGYADYGMANYDVDADIDGNGSVDFNDVLSCLNAFNVFGTPSYQEIY